PGPDRSWQHRRRRAGGDGSRWNCAGAGFVPGLGGGRGSGWPSGQAFSYWARHGLGLREKTMHDACNGNRLGTLTPPQRNKYFYGKLMDVPHFQMEQTYGNWKRWLLNRLALGEGVLC